MADTRTSASSIATSSATIEIQRPPHNFFDVVLINSIADALEALDKDDKCRAVVLAAQGKSFCAGANFGDGSTLDKSGQRPGEAMPPIVASLYPGGAAVPLEEADRRRDPRRGGRRRAWASRWCRTFAWRVPETRFCANFTRLGFHPGFGLTETLPAVIGQTNAAMMFYTSRRVTGEEALAMGLADVLVPQDQVRAAAQKLAAEIAENAPLGVIATRATMRAGLADRVMAATEHELEDADPPAPDRRFQGRRQGDGGAPRAEFRGACAFCDAISVAVPVLSILDDKSRRRP